MFRTRTLEENGPPRVRKSQWCFSLGYRTSRLRSLVVAAIITSLIILFFSTSDSSIITLIRNLAGRTQGDAVDPHVTKSQLTLELKMSDTKISPPTIIATVTNFHPSTTVTLLMWDTPFDDKALLLGLFTIKDIENGHDIPSPGLKLDRELPPPKDAFLEIKPLHAIAKEIVLEGPGAQLDKGGQYEIQAKGKWKAVWHASVADMGYGTLQKIGGGTGVINFEYESNAISIKV